jgi:hypothetical protein
VGVWILAGELEGLTRAALVDSVTMTAFGPTFTDEEEAEAFLSWLAGPGGGLDARGLDDEQLAESVIKFREAHE